LAQVRGQPQLAPRRELISLAVTGGLSDLAVRDAGVLGLAICLIGSTRQRLVLSR
jgi:hypothetical protein